MWTYAEYKVKLINLNGRDLFQATSHGYLIDEFKTVDELQAALGPEVFANLKEVTK
jgi:hypothetical protein